MIPTFNTQAQASSLFGTVHSGQTERPDAEKPPKALDGGSKADLAADAPQAAVVKISAEGARRAQAAQGADTASEAASGAQTALAKVGSDGDGRAIPQEFKAETPAASPADGANAAGTASGAGRPHGVAPAGGQPLAAASGAAAGGPAAGAPASASAGSSTRTYEPADVNEDGTVSPQEQTAYDVKLAAEKAAAKLAESAANSGRSAEAGAAVKAYAAVEQLGQASSTAPA